MQLTLALALVTRRPRHRQCRVGSWVNFRCPAKGFVLFLPPPSTRNEAFGITHRPAFLEAGPGTHGFAGIPAVMIAFLTCLPELALQGLRGR